ncbi:hypothetical protein HOG48_04600 [Candidatus Peregrinibacteria bacterium]|nr:hypothetical protein [Candidatus Peregrinibacteria bacterium]
MAKKPVSLEIASYFEIDDEKITGDVMHVTDPKDPCEDVPVTIYWKDVERISIETNDSGPYGTDVYWRVADSENAMMLPGDWPDAGKILDIAGDWPDFDHDAVIAAMTCTKVKSFVCWEKK